MFLCAMLALTVKHMEIREVTPDGRFVSGRHWAEALCLAAYELQTRMGWKSDTFECPLI